MSKKLWIGGCLGCLFVVLLVGGLAVAGMFWVGSKVQGVATQWQEAAASIEKLQSDFPFAGATLDAPLDETRFMHYVDARAELANILAKRPTLAALLQAAKSGQQPNLSAMQILALVGEIPAAMQDSANALRAEGISFKEFAYYSRLSLMTVKAGSETGDPEMKALWDKLLVGAGRIDGQLAQNNNQGNPPVQIAAFLEDIDTSMLPEETRARIREQMMTAEDAPDMYLLELMLAVIAESNP